MMLFDTHAHYDDGMFDNDRDDIIKGLPAKGVGLILNVSCDMETSLKSIGYAKRYEHVYAAVGVARAHKVAAIGEAGLDYYYDNSPREQQLAVFEQQLETALKLDLPIIIHDREAHNDCLEAVKRYKGVRGVFHCYSGSPEMAREIIRLGMYISFAGPITYKNAKRPVETAKSIPFDRLLIETDCPYLTPVPFRGKRNDSGYLIHTAERIAEILGKRAEEVAEQTYINGRMLIRIN